MQHKKHSVLEVSAGAQPGEVIDAIMRSGGPAKEVPLSQRLFPALMKIGVSSRNRATLDADGRLGGRRCSCR